MGLLQQRVQCDQFAAGLVRFEYMGYQLLVQHGADTERSCIHILLLIGLVDKGNPCSEIHKRIFKVRLFVRCEVLLMYMVL